VYLPDFHEIGVWGNEAPPLAATHRAQSQFLDLHGLIRQRVFIFFQAIGHFFWVSFMNLTEMGCNIFDVT
jgi:hypothetical protein